MSDTIRDTNIASSILAWLKLVVSHFDFQFALSLVVLCSICDSQTTCQQSLKHTGHLRLRVSCKCKSMITSTKVASPPLFSPTDTTTIAAQILLSVLEYRQDYNIHDHHRMSEKHAISMSSHESESGDQELAQILQSSPSNLACVPSKQNGNSLATTQSALLDGLELSLFVTRIGFICPVLLFFNACLYLKRLPFAPLFSLACTILYFLFGTILYFLFVTIKTVFKVLRIVSRILICLPQMLRRIFPFLITTFLAYVATSAFVFVRDFMDGLHTLITKYGRMCQG